ncbi:MAG: hypothetical protein HPY76_06620 [Anaerolineae bacterium]|nr:hypothetical protein [Anaerolineae bacterium]
MAENLPGASDHHMDETRRHAGADKKLWWGIVLIFTGAVFLLQRMGWLRTEINWWAIYIFIPVFGSLMAAVNALRHSGRIDRSARSNLGTALVVGTVAVMLLFGMDWSTWWALMIIVPGFSILLSSIPDPGESAHARTWSSLAAWVGLATMLLGAGFLARTRFGIDPQMYTGGYTWWAVPILLVGMGALISAAITTITGGKFNWSARGNVLIGLATLVVGVIAALDYSWNLIGPLILIVLGLGFLVSGMVK